MLASVVYALMTIEKARQEMMTHIADATFLWLLRFKVFIEIYFLFVLVFVQIEWRLMQKPFLYCFMLWNDPDLSVSSPCLISHALCTLWLVSDCTNNVRTLLVLSFRILVLGSIMSRIILILVTSWIIFCYELKWILKMVF